MSTFRGVFTEFPGIRVDYFESADEEKLYFLSHCHTDHMVGIEGLAELQKAKLICSPISKSILTTLHPEISSCLETIEIGSGRQYTLSDGQVIHCTALPAGHCPGSIMFYFQTESVNVLYTGDFRWKSSDLKQLKILSTIKEDLHAIYVDSTFLLPEFDEFPAQKESVAEVQRLTKEWLDKSEVNRVFLEIPARFGSEYLLKELHNKLKLDMHLASVDQSCLLPFIPEMRQFIVPQLNDSVMVVVGMRNTDLNPRFQWRTIRPSAMYWTNWKRGDPLVKKDKDREQLFRVIYSSHSSSSEIRELLELLQPRTINLNVCPDGRKDRRYDELKKVKLVKTEGQLKEEEQKVEQESPKMHSFVKGYVPPSPDGLKLYKEYLKEIQGDEGEQPRLVIPIRKRIKLDQK